MPQFCKNTFLNFAVRYIGVLRYEKYPSLQDEMLAVALRDLGWTMVYFEPQDVRVKTGDIRGRVFNGRSWVYKIVNVPSIVETAPALYFSSTPFYAERDTLEKGGYVIHGASHITNSRLQRALKGNKFGIHRLATKVIRDVDDLMAFLDKHDAAVVKPNVGSFDGDIFQVRRTDSQTYTIRLRGELVETDASGLQDYVSLHCFDRRYIAEEYFDSTAPNGEPFVIRCVLAREDGGAWKSIERCVQICHAQASASNSGPVVVELETFLRENRPDHIETIMTRVARLEHNLPDAVEVATSSLVYCMAMSLGVNAAGKVSVISVDLRPEVEGASGILLASARASYINWVATSVSARGDVSNPRPSDADRASELMMDSMVSPQSLYKHFDGKLKEDRRGITPYSCDDVNGEIDLEFVRKHTARYQRLLFEKNREKVMKVVDGPCFYPEQERRSRTERLMDQMQWLSNHGFRFNYCENEFGLDVAGDFADPSEYLDRYEFVAETHRTHHGKMRPSRHNLMAINKFFFYSYMDEIVPGCTPRLHFAFKEGRTLAPLTGTPMSMKRALQVLPVGRYACKQSSGGMGVGFFKVEKTEDGSILLNDGKNTYEELVEACKSSTYILQDFVTQHPAISALASNSVNTIRIATARCHRDTHIIYALLRLSSRPDAGLDNASQGGTFVGIDLETGQLRETGSYFYEHRHDTEHPVSHIVYSGYQLPYWEEVKSLVRRLHELFSGCMVIGWDVALTDKGPMILEANTRPCSKMAQMANGGLQKRWDQIRQAY